MTEKRRTPSGSDDSTPSSSVLSGLPRSRPHRRSDKRESTGAPKAAEAPTAGAAKAAAPKARAAATKAAKPKAAAPKAAKPKAAAPKAARPAAARAQRGQMRQPPQPRGVPETPERRRPQPGARRELVATAVQAAAELAEIGLSAGARVLRDAVSRLPRR